MVTAGIEKNDLVVFRELAAGGVLLHLRTGQYHGVNSLGAVIWSLLDGERTQKAVVAEVRARLQDSPPTLEADVERFLDGIRRRDLIR
jgi:hypothetical protein